VPARKLPRSFYLQETTALAKALLGKRLVRIYRGRRISGLIVETEAYLGAGDPVCHTWKGRQTERVKSMYLEGGHAYVYFIYGMHHCFNVVAKGAGEPEAVLIRALEPEENIIGRTDGPGRLARALHIGKGLDGADLCGKEIFLEQSGREPGKEEIGCGPRIGVSYSGEAREAAGWPLRFTWRGSPFLSRGATELAARKKG
jgi:DNA-3-methyladenine glycosylase